MLLNVATELASAVADGLGIRLPAPQPRVLEKPVKPEVIESPALSLFSRPGSGTVATRKVAFLACDGMSGSTARKVHEALYAAGAAPQFIAESLGEVITSDGKPIKIDVTFEATASVLWDAVVLPAGDEATISLAQNDHALDFVKEQYRHCKIIGVLGELDVLTKAVGARATVDELKDDPGIIFFTMPVSTAQEKNQRAGKLDRKIKREAKPVPVNEAAIEAMLSALGKHRNFARELR